MATPVSQQNHDTSLNRGIQNTVVQFENRIRGREMRTQLSRRAGDRSKKSHRSRNAREEDGKKVIASMQTLFAQEEARQMLQQLDDKVTDAEITELQATPPARPAFPYIIVTLSVIKDIFDVVATLSLVGYVLIVPFSFCIAVILFIWIMGKTNGGWWKKRLIRKLFIRYGVVVFVKFLPGVTIIPVTTAFTLMAHYDDTKVVKLINTALEKLHREGA